MSSVSRVNNQNLRNCKIFLAQSVQQVVTVRKKYLCMAKILTDFLSKKFYGRNISILSSPQSNFY